LHAETHPERETLAQQLVATLSAATVATVYPFTNTLEVIVEPGLTAANAWYLVADPAAVDGLAHAFLDGQRAPRIESQPGWNVLGLEFRLHWPLAASFVGHFGWYRNPGA
jgi:hypothetical protein